MKFKRNFLLALLILIIISYGLYSQDNIYALQDRLRNIAKNETPSVVLISTEKIVSVNDDPFNFFFRDPWNNDKKKRERKEGGLGSGLIYSKKGDLYYIVTNNHVVEGVDSITITINEKTYDGKVLGSDPDVDVAVVEIKTNENLKVADVGDSDNSQVGDFVIAIGNPFGLNGTMTFGIISAIGRNDISSGKLNLTNFIQTDASINPGNSGGPLINLNGEVIGINTLIYTNSGGSMGIGFAIPINIVKKVADQLVQSGKVEHGYLGITFEELNEDKIKELNLGDIKYGIHVLSVAENGPAEKAGIKTGDVLLKLDDNELKKAGDLTFPIGNSLPGTIVKLNVLRDSKIFDVSVTLGNRNELGKSKFNNNSDKYSYNGMEMADLNKELIQKYNLKSKTKGVVIINVLQGTQAAIVGIQEGDVIYKVNNKTVNSVKDIQDIIDNSKQYEDYFYINRGGKEFIVKIR